MSTVLKFKTWPLVQYRKKGKTITQYSTTNCTYVEQIQNSRAKYCMWARVDNSTFIRCTR